MANTEYKFVDHYEFDEELLKKLKEALLDEKN